MVEYTKAQFLTFPFLEFFSLAQNNEFSQVYRPNDDSYFFLNVLYLELQKKPPKDSILLEIGSGSGILINHCYSWLK
jgi:methylase of polypeptide subunit release factors